MRERTHGGRHRAIMIGRDRASAGSLFMALAVLTAARAPALAQTVIVNEQAKAQATVGATGDNFGNAVGTDGSTFVVGARFGDGNTINTGSAYVFVQNAAGGAAQQAKLVASNGMASDGFGWSVAVNGDTAVVGSIFANGSPLVFGAGAAYVYTRNTAGVWTQLTMLTAFDGAGVDLFGSAAAMTSNTIVIGSPKDDDACVGSPTSCNSGSVYVYVQNPATGMWAFQAKLHAADAAAGDRFGMSVSIDADTIAVGSFNSANGSLAGAGYVFVRDAMGAWTQQAKLLPTDGAASDFFGNSISISGDTVIGGANRHDNIATDAGAAYVFTRNPAGVWTQQTKLLASDAAANDWFGWSVGVSGDRALVSARLDDDNGIDSGSAYIFTRDAAGVWTQRNKLLASDGAAGDWLGAILAISSQKAIIGASKEDNTNGVDAGSAYIFRFGSAADINGDGVVDGVDLAFLLSAWGACIPAQPCPADLTGDGLIDGADIAFLLSAWG